MNKEPNAPTLNNEGILVNRLDTFLLDYININVLNNYPREYPYDSICIVRMPHPDCLAYFLSGTRTRVLTHSTFYARRTENLQINFSIYRIFLFYLN